MTAGYGYKPYSIFHYENAHSLTCTHTRPYIHILTYTYTVPYNRNRELLDSTRDIFRAVYSNRAAWLVTSICRRLQYERPPSDEVKIKLHLVKVYIYLLYSKGVTITEVATANNGIHSQPAGYISFGPPDVPQYWLKRMSITKPILLAGIRSRLMAMICSGKYSTTRVHRHRANGFAYPVDTTAFVRSQ